MALLQQRSILDYLQDMFYEDLHQLFIGKYLCTLRMPIKNLVLFIIGLISVSAVLYRMFYYPAPLLLLIIISSGFWFIFTQLGTEKWCWFAIPDKFRIYLTVGLTVIALLSILLLSAKTISHLDPVFAPSKNIIPPIIVVSSITVYIAITTYFKKFYPYSVIFSSALLFMVYTSSLGYVSPQFSMSAIGFLAMSYLAIVPIIVIAASWHHEKLKWVFPFSLSIVFGIFTGASVISEEGFELLGTVFVAIPLIILSGIIALILYGLRFRYLSVAEYFNSSLKVFLSLMIYSISVAASNILIFAPFYPRV